MPDGYVPTTQDKHFFFTPGRFADDAYDEDEVFAEVLRLGPSGSPQTWSYTFLHLISGDYSAAYSKLLAATPDAGSASSAAPSVETSELALGRSHFALLLDASGSMADRNGTQTRMEAAKAALTSFAQALPEGASVSLRVYGHEGSNSSADKERSCAASELLFSGQADDAALAQALGSVQPTGWTPLGKAITDAAGDVPGDATDSVVYVVTDGIETCGGDPVEAARTLAAAGSKPIVNVIGFDVGNADQVALRGVAEAGGGTFTPVGSSAELERHLAEEKQRIEEAIRAWEEAEEQRVLEALEAQFADVREDRDALLRRVETERERVWSLIDRLHDEGVLDNMDAHFARSDLSNRYGWMRDELTYMLAFEVGDKWRTERRAALDEIYAQSESRWADLYGDR